jgi:hypothetical protein
MLLPQRLLRNRSTFQCYSDIKLDGEFLIRMSVASHVISFILWTGPALKLCGVSMTPQCSVYSELTIRQTIVCTRSAMIDSRLSQVFVCSHFRRLSC